METLVFERGRDGGSVSRIGGKIALPMRRGPQPAEGEEWEMVLSEDKGRYFLVRLGKRISTAQERAEAEAAAKRARREAEIAAEREAAVRSSRANAVIRWVGEVLAEACPEAARIKHAEGTGGYNVYKKGDTTGVSAHFNYIRATGHGDAWRHPDYLDESIAKINAAFSDKAALNARFLADIERGHARLAASEAARAHQEATDPEHRRDVEVDAENIFFVNIVCEIAGHWVDRETTDSYGSLDGDTYRTRTSYERVWVPQEVRTVRFIGTRVFIDSLRARNIVFEVLEKACRVRGMKNADFWALDTGYTECGHITRMLEA